MYNWLSGKYIPNVYNLVRLAKLLDCSVDYLLGRNNLNTTSGLTPTFLFKRIFLLGKTMRSFKRL